MVHSRKILINVRVSKAANLAVCETMNRWRSSASVIVKSPEKIGLILRPNAIITSAVRWLGDGPGATGCMIISGP
jgi:hypothetical protein